MNFNPTGEAYGLLLDALYAFGYHEFVNEGDTIPGDIWEQWSLEERSVFTDGAIDAENDADEDDDNYDEYDDGQPSEMQEWHDFDPDC